jgi:hypothetical protein
MNQFKYTLWVLAIILAIDLLRPYMGGSKPFKLFGKKGFLPKLLSHGTALVTLLSFYYALVALNDTRKSGEEQSQTMAKQQQSLDSTRRALETMVRLAEDQRKLSAQSGNALNELTKSATRQQDVLSKQLAMSGLMVRQSNRRPLFTFSFNGVDEQRLKSTDTLNMKQFMGSLYLIEVGVQNIGDTVGIRPILLVNLADRTAGINEEKDILSTRGSCTSYRFAEDGIRRSVSSEVNYTYKMIIETPTNMKAFRADFKLTTVNGPQHSKSIILKVPRRD